MAEDEQLLRLYMEQLNSVLIELKDNGKLQATTLQAVILHLKEMEFKLDAHIKIAEQKIKTDEDLDWKKVALWALAIVAFVLGITKHLPILGG